SELTLYGACVAMPGDRPRLAESGRRAAFCDSFRRTPSRHDSARERGVQLGARRFPRFGLRFRDHGCGVGPGRRAATRPVRHAAGWKKEAEDIAAYYAKFGDKLPTALKQQLGDLRKRLG